MFDLVYRFFFKEEFEPRWTFYACAIIWTVAYILFWVAVVFLVIWGFFNFVV